MKFQHVRAIYLCGALVLATGAVAGVSASTTSRVPVVAATSDEVVPQQCTNKKDQPRVLVVVLRSTPDSIGVIAADSIRQAFARYECARYFPVPFDDIKAMLTGSGYDPTKALSPWDQTELAKLASADIVLAGTASTTRGSWTITPMLVVATNHRVTQPLEPVTSNRLTTTARNVLGPVTEALKANPEFRKCWLAEGEGRHEDAVKAARAAIAIYPPSTMARVCLAQALFNLKAPPDSILAATSFVLKVSPKDYYSISFSEKAERAKGNRDKADSLIVELLALNPTDVLLQEDVITKFAGKGDFAGALRILNDAKNTNPGAPEIVNLEATICLATEDWKCAIRAYEELAVVDTAAVTVQYFERLVKAHRELKQFKEASNAAGRGTTKFPDNVNLHGTHAQLLREAGDTAASITAARKAIALDPKKAEIYPQILVIYSGRRQWDSVAALARVAAKHVATANDSLTIANFVLISAQTLFQEAQADSVKDVAKFVEVIKHAALSDSLTAQPPAKLYLVASYFQGATSALKIATETKNCELAKLGASLMAGINQDLLRGATPAHQETVRAIASATFANPNYGQNVVDAVCKPGG